MAYDIDGEVPFDMERDHNRCEHGTYIGGCGIDHICGWCESGISQAERLEIEAAGRRRAAEARIADFDHFVEQLGKVRHLIPPSRFGVTVQALTDMAHEPYYRLGELALEVTS